MLTLNNALTLTISLANFLLGIFVLVKGRRKFLNISFAIFSFITSLWIFSNFIFTMKPSLIIMQSQYAFGTLAMPAALIWIYLLIERRVGFIKFIIITVVGLSIFSLAYVNGLVLREVKVISEGNYSLTVGPLFNYYSIFILLFYVFIIYKLINGLRKSTGIIRTQLKYILSGSLIFGGVSMIADFILPFFDIVPVAPYDAQSSLFFVAFSTYAITKHHLFNIKVIATELFTLAICVILLVKTLLSETLREGAINGAVFVSVGLFGILLIRSVLKEVKQREQIEEMAKQVQKAYELEKHAHKELKRLDEAKTQFLMATQHHLRTPLTSMRGYVDLILGGLYGRVPQKLKEVILKFEKSTVNEIKIVNELLDINQFQLGKEVVSLKPNIQIEPILNEVIEELKFEAESEGIYLKLEKDEKPIPLIKADPSKLKVALSNIIDNAVKYTNKGGVTVKCQISNDKLQIIVKDTGMGIAKEEQKELFTRLFERGAEAKKVFTTGRGIGLYITAKIIEAHHGRIWAESEGKGKGSTFYVELPVG